MDRTHVNGGVHLHTVCIYCGSHDPKHLGQDGRWYCDPQCEAGEAEERYADRRAWKS